MGAADAGGTGICDINQESSTRFLRRTGTGCLQKSKQARAARMIRELRSLGYRVELPSSQPASPA